MAAPVFAEGERKVYSKDFLLTLRDVFKDKPTDLEDGEYLQIGGGLGLGRSMSGGMGGGRGGMGMRGAGGGGGPPGTDGRWERRPMPAGGGGFDARGMGHGPSRLMGNMPGMPPGMGGRGVPPGLGGPMGGRVIRNAATLWLLAGPSSLGR